MFIYSPDFSPESGYGRLSIACSAALGATPHRSAEFAVCDPRDPNPAPIRFTMWEATELPRSARTWRIAKVIIVPCEANRALFRKYTRKPVHVCPLWADSIFQHLPPVRPFKFICIARDNGVEQRKGIDLLIKWFTDAFPTQSNVSLTIKQSPHCYRRYTYDRRINILYEDYKREDYLKLLQAHHCGIFLSGAEAWNLPACELMGAGRPSILIPFGGPVDFTTPDTSWHLPYKLVTSPTGVYESVGYVAQPTKAGTIKAMQQAYEDPLLLASKAIASAQRAADYTEARFAARLRSIVAQYGFQTSFSQGDC